MAEQGGRHEVTRFDDGAAVRREPAGAATAESLSSRPAGAAPAEPLSRVTRHELPPTGDDRMVSVGQPVTIGSLFAALSGRAARRFTLLAALALGLKGALPGGALRAFLTPVTYTVRETGASQYAELAALLVNSQTVFLVGVLAMLCALVAAVRPDPVAVPMVLGAASLIKCRAVFEAGGLRFDAVGLPLAERWQHFSAAWHPDWRLLVAGGVLLAVSFLPALDVACPGASAMKPGGLPPRGLPPRGLPRRGGWRGCGD